MLSIAIYNFHTPAHTSLRCLSPSSVLPAPSILADEPSSVDACPPYPHLHLLEQTLLRTTDRRPTARCFLTVR